MQLWGLISKASAQLLASAILQLGKQTVVVEFG